MGTYGHFTGYMQILERAKVVAVADKNLKVVENIVAKFGAKGHSSYVELLSDYSVESHEFPQTTHSLPISHGSVIVKRRLTKLILKKEQ